MHLDMCLSGHADPQSISTVRRESNSNPSWLLPWETLLGNPVNAAKGKKYHKHSFSLSTSIICVFYSNLNIHTSFREGRRKWTLLLAALREFLTGFSPLDLGGMASRLQGWEVAGKRRTQIFLTWYTSRATSRGISAGGQRVKGWHPSNHIEHFSSTRILHWGVKK